MSYGEMIRLLTKMQEESNVQFDLVFNSKEQTIEIKYIN
jgi:hypothetical protein